MTLATRLAREVEVVGLKLIDLDEGHSGEIVTEVPNTWDASQCRISQQPLVGSYPNFKLKLRGSIQTVKSLKLKMTPMEDDLKILNVEYLSNHWLDLIQILNLS